MNKWLPHPFSYTSQKLGARFESSPFSVSTETEVLDHIRGNVSNFNNQMW